MSQLFRVKGEGGHYHFVSRTVMLKWKARDKAKAEAEMSGDEEADLLRGDGQKEDGTKKCPTCEEGVCNEHDTESSEQILDKKEDAKEEKKTEVLKEEKPKFSLFSKKDKKEKDL